MKVHKVGPHRFYHGSMFKVPEIKPTLIFTDPPWDQRVLNTFHRLAEKKKRKFGEFMQEYLAFINGFDCPKVIMMGNRYHGILTEGLAGNIQTVNCTYNKGRSPFTLIGVNYDVGQNEGADFPEVVEYITRTNANPENLIYDPCCGRLLLLEKFIANGIPVVGSEIIWPKLAKGLRKAKQLHKVRP